MLRPLSEKTLEKKYAELGLSKEKTDRLHTCFLCFANLYGVITVRDAWKIYRYYEGASVRRKDFAAFSGIVQREAGHPYSVYELREIYKGETSEDPLDRMIVSNDLVLHGYNRFVFVYATVERQGNKPYYLPDRETFLSFAEDRFYLTPAGREMKSFLEELRTGGIEKDRDGKPRGTLTDLHGAPAAGKRLADAVFITHDERFDIDYEKSEAKKQRLREQYSVPASEKLLTQLRRFLMSGGIYADTPAQEMTYIGQTLTEDYGVELTEKQAERFAELFLRLNNTSHLWLNAGWSPEELFRQSPSHSIDAISVGPNLKRLIASGEIDGKELEEKLGEMGITLMGD